MSRRHKHSQSYKVLREEISAVRNDLANLTTMVREQHDHLSKQIDDLRMFIERLCQVRFYSFRLYFFLHTDRIVTINRSLNNTKRSLNNAK